MNFKDFFKHLPKGFRIAETEEDLKLVNLTIALAFADAEYPTPPTKISHKARLRANYIIIEEMISNAAKNGAVLSNDDFSAAMVVVPFCKAAKPPLDKAKEALIKEASEVDANAFVECFNRAEELQNKIEVNPNSVYVECFAVQTVKQGNHLGSTLMRKLFEICDENGIDTTLFTNVKRNKLIYEHLGFDCKLSDYSKRLNFETYIMVRKYKKIC